METANYVADLTDYAQKNRLHLKFEDCGSEGPDHDKTFIQKAVIDGKTYPRGVGKSRKDAKKLAARNALQRLRGGDVSLTENSAEASASVHQSSINYICWLNEFGQKNRVTITPVESTKPGINNVIPCCSFKVGDKTYPIACGKSKTEAKQNAAKLVYDDMYAELADEGSNNVSSQQDEDLSRSSNDTRSNSTDANYVGLINGYCQKTSKEYEFSETRRCGPDHSPRFYYILKIDNKEYPEAEGNSVKEAKQRAAELAWTALQEEPDWDSKFADENSNNLSSQQDEDLSRTRVNYGKHLSTTLWTGTTSASTSRPIQPIENEQEAGDTGLRQNEVKLSSARTEFINRMSRPGLKSLLDVLLEKKVVTTSEMEHIHEITGRDQARELIDTVQRKGELACKILIESLCELDPCISDTLHLK